MKLQLGVYSGARTWEMSVGQHVEQKSRGFRAAPLALLKSGEEDNDLITQGLGGPSILSHLGMVACGMADQYM